ncbi:glycosyltransferase family 1 protein [Clostridium cadaveris]|uniref:glycosyltransferase family 1 protein n=1 Tax=Clostridium cadaveris TaxID=1529 RepID=UPI00041FE3BB|nr:glycosyltransferase family 1 protein [Clostridium cadaveris]
MKKEKNDIKRLLCIVGGMNAGGAETFLMKVYRALDKTKYQMDFYVSVKEECIYDKEIIEKGGIIFHSVPKSKNPIKSFCNLLRTVKKHNYQYVMRVSQHSLSALDLLAAKLGGAQKLIYRSSNSQTCGRKVNRIMHKLFKWLSIMVPNVKIAPSTEAAEFMFGKNCVKNGKAKIIKNAIPVEKFAFNQAKRDRIRMSLGIENKFVIGHVGRFNNQKNHSFLLDIFSEVYKKNKDSVLLLVGNGELEKDINKKVKLLGLEDKVIFTGVRSDVSDIMMAMDIFVFPSLFEGMPNTVIEAQATGLPCIVSDKITKEAKLIDIIKYKSLNDKASEWANVILDDIRIERESMKKYLVDKGYEIESVTRELEKLIFKYENIN